MTDFGRTIAESDAKSDKTLTRIWTTLRTIAEIYDTGMAVLWASRYDAFRRFAFDTLGRRTLPWE